MATYPKKKLAKNDPRHGTITGYGYWKCRCEACRTGYNEAMKKYKKARMQAVISGEIILVHGSASTYNNYDCRCKACKAARNKVDVARKDVPRKNRYREKGVPHGTYNGYNKYKCSCKACKEANRERYYKYKKR